jgi:hypothetical protein
MGRLEDLQCVAYLRVGDERLRFCWTEMSGSGRDTLRTSPAQLRLSTMPSRYTYRLIESIAIPASSMWRDINCFNEMRIPAITYGPGVSAGGGTYGIKIADMITATRVYAQTALDLCNQARK